MRREHPPRGWLRETARQLGKLSPTNDTACCGRLPVILRGTTTQCPGCGALDPELLDGEQGRLNL